MTFQLMTIIIIHFVPERIPLQGIFSSVRAAGSAAGYLYIWPSPQQMNLCSYSDIEEIKPERGQKMQHSRVIFLNPTYQN